MSEVTEGTGRILDRLDDIGLALEAGFRDRLLSFRDLDLADPRERYRLGPVFLLDDAFRMGEYIETSGAKGTVERISVRSVSLRHSRGSVATIPYGQIGKIQNYSRDWVIEKLAFRVAFDTDVEKVRKLFKQIGQSIAADPELKADLIEPFKSQGIASVEDGTLLIRGKFKARAGRQFAIRKAILSAVPAAFRDNGIRAVPKPMSISDEPAGAR